MPKPHRPWPYIGRRPCLTHLTHPLEHGQLNFPFDPKLSILVHNTVESIGNNITQISMSAHQGTHLDAPFHFFNDGKTIDQMPATVWAPSSPYRMPLHLSRCPITVLHAASIGPEPICQPFFRYRRGGTGNTVRTGACHWLCQCLAVPGRGHYASRWKTICRKQMRHSVLGSNEFPDFMEVWDSLTMRCWHVVR